MGIDGELKQEIVRRILAVAKPQGIILFGSAAADRMTKDSDIDLLVVEQGPSDTRAESIRLRRALGGVGYPIDVIVLSAERFEESKGVVASHIQPTNTDRSYMRTPDEVRRESVKKWVAKAGEDLETAFNLLNQNWPFRGIVAFHAQQAVEKYLKAFLMRHEIEFPKTHDIGVLLELVGSVDPKAAADLRDAEGLTIFGVEIRYPDEAPELLPGAEAELVETARRTRRFDTRGVGVRRVIPAVEVAQDAFKEKAEGA